MSDAKKLRILLLDDDKFILEFITDLLIQLGISEVLVAQDGKAGLSVLAAQTKNVDLLICDIEMPGMDGIEFLRNIANQGYNGKIVLFSGIDADLLRAVERLAKARGLDVIGTLAKPVTVGSLAGVLDQLPQPFQKKNRRF
jgi:CheY-like chemotaxis protein